jgi:hypothetical protein
MRMKLFKRKPKQKRCWVLCRNDFPLQASLDEEDAKLMLKRLKDQEGVFRQLASERKENRMNIYYSLQEVGLL